MEKMDKMDMQKSQSLKVSLQKINKQYKNQRNKDMKSLNTVRTSTAKVTRWSRLRSRITSLYSRITLVLLLMFGFSISLQAQEQEIDSVQRAELWKDPNFVRAYYVVAEPGGALYSIFGHACLHMVCPAYDIDYIYSYESEDAVKKVWTFLAGNLHMGMVRMTKEDYLEDFVAEGRGVKEYELNLPIDVKRNLWKVLDEKVEEGMNLPYDFESRGCAYACVAILKEALGEDHIAYGDWSPRFNRTRREMCNDFGKRDYPWNMMFIMALVGTEVDKMLTPEEKMIIPTEVVEVWQNAKVNGEYLLSREANELLPSKKVKSASPWFTPTLVALLLLLLAIVALFVEKPYIDWFILGVVTCVGVAMTYLVVFSSLPCTSWNWLIIPFNILPAICWKWRKYWSSFYVGMIVMWIVCMLISSHQLVDQSMIILALTFVVILLNKRNRIEKIGCINKKH